MVKAADSNLTAAPVILIAVCCVSMLGTPVGFQVFANNNPVIAQEAVDQEYGIKIRGTDFKEAVESQSEINTLTLTYSKDGDFFSIPITLVSAIDGNQGTIDLLMSSEGDQSELTPFSPEEAKKLTSALSKA